MRKPHIWKYGEMWFCGRPIVSAVGILPETVSPIHGYGDTPTKAYAHWAEKAQEIDTRVEELKYRTMLLTEDSAGKCETKIVTAWRRYWPLVAAACLALVGLMALVLDSGWRL